MKYYNKFYEVDNNVYYTISVDDDLFIGTESMIKMGKKKLFRKENKLTMGFKLLKLTAPITQLFVSLDELKPAKKQPYGGEDMTVYDILDNEELKKNINKSYTQVIDDTIKDVEKQRKVFLNEGKNELADSCQMYIEKLKKTNPLDGINLETPINTASLIIKYMLKSGLEHLYTEKVNAFTNNVFLYEQDMFGTLTIYKVITIKNVVKTIDTFIYDKNVIKSLLKTIYEEGR